MTKIRTKALFTPRCNLRNLCLPFHPKTERYALLRIAATKLSRQHQLLNQRHQRNTPTVHRAQFAQMQLSSVKNVQMSPQITPHDAPAENVEHQVLSPTFLRYKETMLTTPSAPLCCCQLSCLQSNTLCCHSINIPQHFVRICVTSNVFTVSGKKHLLSWRLPPAFHDVSQRPRILHAMNIY